AGALSWERRHPASISPPFRQLPARRRRSQGSVAIAQTAIVCSADNNALAAELDRIRFPVSDRIHNPQPELGMFSSIQCAAKWDGWNESLTHWIITLGDQPHIQLRTLEALLTFSAKHPNAICQPSRNARPRHPVVVPKHIFRQLSTVAGPTLKDFLNAHALERKLIEVDDPG